MQPRKGGFYRVQVGRRTLGRESFNVPALSVDGSRVE